MRMFGPLGTVQASLGVGAGPLTFHITPLDWRMWWHHNVIESGNITINRRDYWLGPFRVQYIVTKKRR